MTIWTWLEGKKTYISAIAAIIVAIASGIDRTIPWKDVAFAVWAALQTIFIRHGMKTNTTKIITTEDLG